MTDYSAEIDSAGTLGAAPDALPVSATLSDDELDALCEAALEVSRRAVVVVDVDTVLFANASARALLAVTARQNIVGQPVDDILHPVVREAARERRQVMLASGGPLCGYQTKLLAGDGRPVPTAASGRPLAGPARRAILFELGGDGELCDVGEPWPRRTVVQAAAEALPDGIAIHDESRVLFANAATRRLIGATVEQMEGAHFSEFVHPDAAEAGRARRELTWPPDVVMHDVPLKLVRMDGEHAHAYAEAFWSPIGDRSFTVLVLRENRF